MSIAGRSARRTCIHFCGAQRDPGGRFAAHNLVEQQQEAQDVAHVAEESKDVHVSADFGTPLPPALGGVSNAALARQEKSCELSKKKRQKRQQRKEK